MMKESIKVSVCIPAYNNEEVIGATIKAILEQTYQNLELIVVDDASKDKTVEVVKKFAQKDSRVSLYQNEKNLGMTGNWNRCVELAGSEYIKLICADDILLPQSLEIEMKELRSNKNIVMTINDSIMISESGRKRGVFQRYYKKGVFPGKEIARKSLIASNFFGMPCAVLFKKSTFEKVGGFDPQFKYILDFDLWIRLAGEGDVNVLEPKLNYFMLRKDSNTGKVFSKDQDVYMEEHKKLINKYCEKYQLSTMEMRISVFSRWLRNMGYGIWLKWVLRKEK